MSMTMDEGEAGERERLRARIAGLEAEVGRLRVEGQSEAEQRLRHILDSAVEYAIFTTDLEGRVTTWNEGARRILGFDEPDILGQPIEIIFTPEDRAAGGPQEEMRTCLAEGRAEDARWHLRKDGSRFLARGFLMPLRAGDSVQGFLKILRDRTAEHRAEEMLRQALDHQQVLAREINHRVKNSLHLVANLLQLQQIGTKDPEVSHALSDAAARVLVVAQIHDRLWRQDDPDLVDFGGFVRNLCLDLQRTAPNCTIACDAQLVNVPTRVAMPMGLVLNELVTNAFKYGCADGHGQVDVRVSTEPEGLLHLEVRDHGDGLPDGFDVSRQAHSLGMRLIAGIVRQFQGSVEAEPAHPGARFRVSIAPDAD